MLKDFYHTGFVVRDIEESVAFYTDVMGLKLLFRTERTGEFIEKVVGFKGAHLKGAFLSMGNGHNLGASAVFRAAQRRGTRQPQRPGSQPPGLLRGEYRGVLRRHVPEGSALHRSSRFPGTGRQGGAQGSLRPRPRRQLAGGLWKCRNDTADRQLRQLHLQPVPVPLRALAQRSGWSATTC